MKICIAAVALATALIVPALTQVAIAGSPDEVIVGGKSVGQDPDANVRLQLRRDAGSENY